ncbi:alpha/beta hydrolase, partial [Pseudomonas sp. MPR-R2A3]
MFYTAKADSIGLFLRKAFWGEQYKKHPFRPYMN